LETSCANPNALEKYNPVGGATNDETKHKQLFVDPSNTGPKVIIMDPELTLTTPERVWLSTGLRAVDHCVETMCSSKPKPEGSVYSTKGIRLLIPSLLKTKKNPGDLEARLKAQLGSAESMKASIIEGVPVGGSHGIGHQLGPYGVPHAETTCVCLPAVQKFNAKVNSDQQKEVLDVLWSEPAVAEVLRKRDLAEGKADLGDALDAIIRELGFPRSLKAYGVGRDSLDAIAESSLGDVCSKWNAIPLLEKGQVMEILEMCLED
jgi:alcohol dehydrogenase class IV